MPPRSSSATDAVSSQMTLPARYYTDPAIFTREMERFFIDQWVCVGRAEQVVQPGDYFLCAIAGESVIVTKDSGGAIRAFYNVCRHRGTRMCTEETGTFAGRIQCPYHGWSYGLDGALKGAPHMDQPGFDRADYPLHPVRAEVWEGHLFLNLSNADGLAAQVDRLAPLSAQFAAWKMPELRLASRVTYDVAANWKLIIQNYSECLHCPLLHPSLNRLTDYMGSDNAAPSPAWLGGSMGFRAGCETMSVDGVRRRDYLPGLDASQRQQVSYYAIHPNLLLSLHPDYMMTHTLWPRAVDRTEIVCEFHFHAAEMAKADFHPDDAVAFWDETNREDWQISEQSQQGISSRAYTPGPYSSREELLAAFDRRIVAERESE